jgi:hypothetical protein
MVRMNIISFQAILDNAKAQLEKANLDVPD